jgi:hypothetical protein
LHSLSIASLVITSSTLDSIRNRLETQYDGIKEELLLVLGAHNISKRRLFSTVIFRPKRKKLMTVRKWTSSDGC